MLPCYHPCSRLGLGFLILRNDKVNVGGAALDFVEPDSHCSKQVIDPCKSEVVHLQPRAVAEDLVHAARNIAPALLLDRR